MLVGHSLMAELVGKVAVAASGPGKPLENTDLSM